VAAKLAEFSSMRDRRALLRGKLSRHEAVVKEQARTAAAIATAQKEIVEIEAALGDLEFDPDHYQKASDELAVAQKQFDDSSEQANEAVRELEVCRRELELKEQQLAAFQQTEQRLKELRDTVWHDEKVKTLLGSFRKQVIAGIRPTLAATAGRLMADMTDGRYGVVELDEDYNLHMLDGGRTYPIERFSGGEKDLANLCLRLAISQTLTQAAGIDRAGIMLDEIFGSQDDVRRELIFEGLAGLTRTFSQVLLVTHIEEIKNRVGALVEVRPTAAGFSEAILHV